MGEAIAKSKEMWIFVRSIEGKVKERVFCNNFMQFILTTVNVTSIFLLIFQVALTKLVFLPTGDSQASKKELLIARDVLEIAVKYSVATKDIPAFERYIAQLKCYYFDYK